MISSTQRYQLWPQMGLVFVVSSLGLAYLSLFFLFDGNFGLALEAALDRDPVCILAIALSSIVSGLIA
ncbi:TPA: hypothetical protein ACGGR3_003172, partial [Vibrio cholerae]